jgi:hypothetical protein
VKKARSIAIMATLCLATAAAASAQEKPPELLPPAEAREVNLRAYVELLRADLRAQKVAVITEMMRFTDAEEAAFWPVYREYEGAVARLNEERLRLIDAYARTFFTITTAAANEMAMKSLDLEARRTALKQKYYGRLRAVLSPVTAARALQIENQIQAVIDLQVAAALPVLR